MRYRVVVNRNGENVTLCNIAERDRAIRISDCYPGSFVIDSSRHVIHIHTVTGFKLGR